MATMQGTVQKWISHKGYGFIDCGQEQNLFVHANDLANGRQSLNIQENVKRIHFFFSINLITLYKHTGKFPLSFKPSNRTLTGH